MKGTALSPPAAVARDRPLTLICTTAALHCEAICDSRSAPGQRRCRRRHACQRRRGPGSADLRRIVATGERRLLGLAWTTVHVPSGRPRPLGNEGTADGRSTASQQSGFRLIRSNDSEKGRKAGPRLPLPFGGNRPTTIRRFRDQDALPANIETRLPGRGSDSTHSAAHSGRQQLKFATRSCRAGFLLLPPSAPRVRGPLAQPCSRHGPMCQHRGFARTLTRALTRRPVDKACLGR